MRATYIHLRVKSLIFFSFLTNTVVWLNKKRRPTWINHYLDCINPMYTVFQDRSLNSWGESNQSYSKILDQPDSLEIQR